MKIKNKSTGEICDGASTLSAKGVVRDGWVFSRPVSPGRVEFFGCDWEAVVPEEHRVDWKWVDCTEKVFSIHDLSGGQVMSVIDSSAEFSPPPGMRFRVVQGGKCLVLERLVRVWMQ